jgi:hypothetical protein
MHWLYVVLAVVALVVLLNIALVLYLAVITRGEDE